MKFQPRSEKTRQFIIESTADVFNKKGYAGTSLTDLTEATKLTKGSIYGNFENKEEVAAAVLMYNIARSQATIAAKIEKATTPKEKLLVYAHAYSEKFTAVAAEGGCPYLNCGTEADDTNEKLRQQVVEGLQRWKQSIVSIINEGISTGDFKSDANSEKTAISMIALIEGGIFLGTVHKSQLYLNTVCQAVEEMVLSICT